MEEMYFTITGCNHYFGTEFLKEGMKLKLEKEPDNKFDSEAILVKLKGLGKIGYVANSPYTVKGESMSAEDCMIRLEIRRKPELSFCLGTEPFAKLQIADWRKS